MKAPELGMRQKISFSLGQYTTVFLAEVFYANKAYNVQNIKRGYL
jgi:hypothetical protein